MSAGRGPSRRTRSPGSGGEAISWICRGALDGAFVVHHTGELERAHEHGAVPAHGVCRLRAESARLKPVALARAHPALRKRVDRAARIAERAVDPIRALHDDREIGRYRMCRPAL